MNLKVKIQRVPGANIPLPTYAHDGDAGMDLRSANPTPMTIPPSGSLVIPTGLCIEIPIGYEGQIRNRSGLAIDHHVVVVNSPGTVDSSYREQIYVLLANFCWHEFVINHGDRIAQLVVAPVARVEWEEVDKLTWTERGDGGFGSSGRRDDRPI